MLCGYVAYKRPAPANITRGTIITSTSKQFLVYVLDGKYYNQRVYNIHDAISGKKVGILTRAGGILH